MVYLPLISHLSEVPYESTCFVLYRLFGTNTDGSRRFPKCMQFVRYVVPSCLNSNKDYLR